jgi:hypothetical protein
MDDRGRDVEIIEHWLMRYHTFFYKANGLSGCAGTAGSTQGLAPGPE